ncbi:LysR substrate-binding domain-containing protein [Microbacterium sp.]|uniref:LysR substrate-binding domain-containing protein n=1 Tax=Microbacterium sp. TaxID=51671 RepID=UPI003A925D51
MARTAMSRVTLRQLEYFRAIAATGSLAAAAEQLHVSRSTIAGALDDLESGLGTQLCVRHKSQGIELTAAGRTVLESSLGVLTQVEDLESVAHPHRLSGVLSVGCFGSLAPTVLPKLISRFTADHPDVQVDIEIESTDVLIERVMSGRLDLIISYRLHTDPRLDGRQLYETRMHAVLPIDHPLARQSVIDARDLADEPMVMMTTPPSEEDIADYYASMGIVPNVKYRVSHFELGRSLVAAGLGYGLYIQRPRHDLTYDGIPLATRPLNPPPLPGQVRIAWPRGRALSAKSAAFTQLALLPEHELAPRSLYTD